MQLIARMICLSDTACRNASRASYATASQPISVHDASSSLKNRTGATIGWKNRKNASGNCTITRRMLWMRLFAMIMHLGSSLSDSPDGGSTLRCFAGPPLIGLPGPLSL